MPKKKLVMGVEIEDVSPDKPKEEAPVLEFVDVNGDKISLEEILKESGEEVKKKELPNMDWNSVKNKVNFADWVALRKVYGLEG